MYWFLTITLLIFTFNNLSEAKYGKKLPPAVVIGTVYCDTCFRTDFSKTSHFISGALVAVECGVTKSKPNFRKEVRTNERGEFEVRLPFAVSKHVKKIKGCSVKLISSSEPYCAVASTATSYSLHLKSRKQGVHIFSAGFFTFKPLQEPTLCSQKPSLLNSKKSWPQDATPILPYQPPTNQNLLPPLPELPNLPPMLPQLPLPPILPQLPPLPPLPAFPNLPEKASKNSEKSKSSDPFKASEVPLFPFPPNPFQPPSLFPPNPFLPPPLAFPPRPLPMTPPSIFPRNPSQPSPPSIFPRNPFQPSPPVSRIPPLVGLTPPSPPPPVSANVPVGLPRFPFQPAPGFPGVPPTRKTTSP